VVKLKPSNAFKYVSISKWQLFLKDFLIHLAKPVALIYFLVLDLLRNPHQEERKKCRKFFIMHVEPPSPNKLPN